MRRAATCSLLACIVLAGCEKPPLITYPGDPAAAPGTVANNARPTANAGADVTLQWPADIVELSGTATDDGQPSSALTYSWVASPATVLFVDATASRTTARFPEPGTYILTLSVDDGALQANDSLVVTVNPATTPVNAPPVVSAGNDISTEVPRPASLAGTVADDGLPTTTLTMTWSVVNGPGTVTFTDAAAATTKATFDTVGTYELRLTASDGELSSTDSVLVTVGPAIYPGPDDDSQVDRAWLRIAPAEVGMDATLLAQAEAYALTAGGAGLISRYGRLVHSWGRIDDRYDIKSSTKSIGGIALAFAIDDKLVNIEDRASQHLPAIGQLEVTNDPAQTEAITLLQLATHTAGFEKRGGYGRLLDPPGTAWRYSDGGLNWLADVLTTVYGQDLQAIFKPRLYSVLGINERDDIQWRTMEDGLRPNPRPLNVQHREFAAGMIANVNAMARVGLLYLRRGEWDGGQRVFSSAFVDLVRTPRPENAALPVREPTEFPEANARYGVLWWTNATGALPNVPRDAYWAWGLNDSLIVVIPSLDLVIARAGPTSPTNTPGQRVFGDRDWNSDYTVLAPFLDPIVQATTP
jgi:CubicO group peptidase (beta-lactamase class C family)